MELSQTEENYLKAIYTLTIEKNELKGVGTSTLSQHLDIKPASANEMLKRLKEKQLVDYVKYGKITLTESGSIVAVQIVRKHRIWETFLFDTLQYNWDEIHDIAEQLEHIQSPDLTERLYDFLKKPKTDPHGEIIPVLGKSNQMQSIISLKHATLNKKYQVQYVKDRGKEFLQLLDTLQIHLGSEIIVTEKMQFDNSITITINGETLLLSDFCASNIFIEDVSK